VDVTAIVVFCCTPKLVEPCLSSFRRYYPNMRLVIIDNSKVDNCGEGPQCAKALREYCKKDKNAELHIMPFNIGHGFGLHYGMLEVKTKYAYIFEPDVDHLKKDLIENMISVVKKETYGVGYLFNTTYCEGHYTTGIPYNGKGERLETMKMIWLYSSLIVTKRYFDFLPFDSDDGSNAVPLHKSSQSIHDSGDDAYVRFNVNNYVIHKEHVGTRHIIGIPTTENKWNLW